jgi:hypothetical protein
MLGSGFRSFSGRERLDHTVQDRQLPPAGQDGFSTSAENALSQTCIPGWARAGARCRTDPLFNRFIG